MTSSSSIIVRDLTPGPAAKCIVCGKEIAAGEGLTAHYGDRTLRFKCPGCLARFEEDPDRFLAREPAACCADEGHLDASASEWICDR